MDFLVLITGCYDLYIVPNCVMNYNMHKELKLKKRYIYNGYTDFMVLIINLSKG